MVRNMVLFGFGWMNKKGILKFSMERGLSGIVYNKCTKSTKLY